MPNSDSITIKLFLGFHYNGEIKVHLNQSHQWKEAKLFQNQSLTETSFQDKEYIGVSIDFPLSYDELKKMEKDLKCHLQHYCPKIQIDKHKLYLFSQVFLS